MCSCGAGNCGTEPGDLPGGCHIAGTPLSMMEKVRGGACPLASTGMGNSA